MTFVLRVVRQARWDWPSKCDWLSEGELPADPLADFAGTSCSALSVWFVNEDKSNLDVIVAALAASREKADKLDYVLFSEKHLDDLGLDCRPSRGNTPDASANVCHRDLTHLSAGNVLALTARVWDDHREIDRRDKATVVNLIADAVRAGRIAPQRLRPKLRDTVEKHLHNDDDLPRLPK